MIRCNYPGCRAEAETNLGMARHHLADHDGRVRGPDAQTAAVADLFITARGADAVHGFTVPLVAATFGLSADRARDVLAHLVAIGLIVRGPERPARYRRAPDNHHTTTGC